MVQLIYLGHSAFKIINDDVSFVIDPYANRSVPGMYLPHVEANYVFCSHGHSDHNAKELVIILPTNKNIKYETIVVPHDHENGAKRGLNNMYLFYLDNYKILHVGDLGCFPSKEILNKITGVDIILAPINGFFTISARELHDICEIIKPKTIIPIHYYRKEDNSGYPDGNQIDIFKGLYNDYLEVNNYSLKVNDELLKNRAVILNKYYQD